VGLKFRKTPFAGGSVAEAGGQRDALRADAERYTRSCHLEVKRAVRRLYRLALCELGSLAMLAGVQGQRLDKRLDKPIATVTEESELTHRKEIPSEAVSVEGLIRLDTTVTDEVGKAVAGLRREDFNLLDDGQPQKIIAFRASAGSFDDSLSVIILLDTLNMPSDLAVLERQQAAHLLLEHSGRLAQPVTIYSLEDSGFFLTAKSSTDGKELSAEVTADNKAAAYFVPLRERWQFKAASVESSFESFPALAGLRALGTIATTEASRPGRKVVLWIGPGQSNRGTGSFDPDIRQLRYSIAGKKGEEVKRDLFQKICWFSILLRQARIVLDCFSLAEGSPKQNSWNRFLAGVPLAEQASWMNLFKNVLAVQSGGRVLPSSNDLVGPMNECIDNARIFYTLTFDPPLAAHANEYHSLKVDLNRPTLTAHTSTGYYDQPFYDDPADPGTQRLTVAQLEKILQTARGASSVHDLSAVVLTDRLSGVKLQSLLAEVRKKKARESLEMIAAESTFLSPPTGAKSADPPPSAAEQQRMLSAAADYLGRVIPRLPKFFAIRTANSYREVAVYPGLNTVDGEEPLHAEGQVKETVLYRQGAEIVSSALPHTVTQDQPLQTYGTFGPILELLQDLLKSPDNIKWGWWEDGPDGRRAVFRFRTTETPTLDLVGCCYPDGNMNNRIRISADMHGELVIAPSTGAIVRIQKESELAGFVPTKRSDLMVSYGPVEIAGKTYILPLRSVSLWRGRSVATLPQWNVGFAVWGPYETRMNVFNFDQFHEFRGDAHILSGFERVPEK
jgi:VWFA-related protein